MEDFESQFRVENDQIQFHPSDKIESEFIFLQLKAEWSFLQKKLQRKPSSLQNSSYFEDFTKEIQRKSFKF